MQSINPLTPDVREYSFTIYIYYRNMPVLKFPFNSPHFTPENLPCPFFYYTSPTKKNLFKTGEIIPKAYLEGYYGIIIRRRSYIYYRNMPVL